MITKQRALFFFVGQTPYKDLKEAQKADLIALMPTNEDNGYFCDDTRLAMANWIIENATTIVDTLTTTPTSRLRARKSHGGTKKPRRPKLQPAKLDQP